LSQQSSLALGQNTKSLIVTKSKQNSKKAKKIWVQGFKFGSRGCAAVEFEGEHGFGVATIWGHNRENLLEVKS
jgi:putative heme iron utilization protein